MKDAAGSGQNHIPGLIRRIGRFIDPGMNESVKGVGQPHYLHPGSDVLSGQPVGIAGAVPTLMVVAAHVTDGGERLTLPQLRYLLQQFAALGGMGLHNLKFFTGQVSRFVENFLRDSPLAHVMEQGERGIELNFLCGQRRNDGGGGKDTQKPLRQVFKLYAVGRVVNEKLLPAQNSKCGFYVQIGHLVDIVWIKEIHCMKKVKITILQTTFNEELAKEYGADGLGPCPMMKEGQVFYADYAKPEGFCDEAWKAIYQYVFALAHGAGNDVFYFGDWIRKPGVAICSCNDGLRPVIMKLEATDQPSNIDYTPVERQH